MAFLEPRTSAPVDLEAHLRATPAGATTKGMFFSHLIGLAETAAPTADVVALAGLSPRRYVGFLDYPYVDLLRLLYAAPRLVYPKDGVGLGLRKLGRTIYPLFLGSHVGRVLFGVLGSDVERVVALAPRGYALSTPFADVSGVQIGPRHFQIAMRGFPGFLETQQVGVFEGALLHYGLTPRVTVDVVDLATATLDVRW